MQAWGNDPRRWSQGPEANLLQRISAFMALPPAARRASSDAAARAARTAAPGAAAGQSAAADADVPAARRVLLPGRRPLSSRAGRGRPHEAAVPAPHCRRPAASTTKAATRCCRTTSIPTGLPGEQSFGLFGDSPMAAALPPRPDRRHQDHAGGPGRARARPRGHGAGARPAAAPGAPADATSTPSRGPTSPAPTRPCWPRWRATSRWSCCRATSTPASPPTPTTGRRRPASPCARRASSSWCRAA